MRRCVSSSAVNYGDVTKKVPSRLLLCTCMHEFWTFILFYSQCSVPRLLPFVLFVSPWADSRAR
jgi:hypothetical protein